MKHLRNKRKNVTLGEKFRFLGLAINEMDIRRDAKFRTDVIGLACQYSSHLKLKREDFEGMLDKSLRQLMNEMDIK